MENIDDTLKALHKKQSFGSMVAKNAKEWVFSFFHEILEVKLMSPNLYIVFLIFETI